MKCKHGYSNCSECGEQNDDKEFFNEYEKSVKFNRKCSEIMGFRPAWKHYTHYYLSPEGDEILLSEWQPYKNIHDLVKVVDYIIDDDSEAYLDMLVKNIIDNSVTEAFHMLIEQYHEKHHKAC